MQQMLHFYKNCEVQLPFVNFSIKLYSMSFNIFYSWQAKTTLKYNRYFIEECLKESIKQIKRDLQDSTPEFYIDRDTKDIPGRPNIPTTIEEKIRVCDVFIGDLSYVAYIDTDKKQPKRSFLEKLSGKNKWIQEGVYSTNVAEELGTANGALKGSERIVTVMNIVYGTPDQLNFDSKQSRYPLTYQYDSSTTNEQRLLERKKLIGGLKDSIKLILETEHERQKEHFSPFIIWKNWEKLIDRPFAFESTDYLNSVFKTILNEVNNPKCIFRLCGLSGIGKTRMIFECFANPDAGHPEMLSNKVLYIDANENEDKQIIKGVKELLHHNENKILIVDNCSKELHIDLSRLIVSTDSRLSVITVSTNPEEKVNELDTNRDTRLIVLDNQLCKVTVDQILSKNFKEFQEDEQKLLVEFSSGIAFIATLMAKNPDRGKHQPGSLTREDVVRRLLGPIFSDQNSRAVVFACSLFSKFGFSDDLSYQTDKIALNSDLFSINTVGIEAEDIDEWKKMKFRDTCKFLHERQLLEKKCRTFTFRPSPLAVRMAEDWWGNCTIKKFERIIPVLREADLVESFCEQFRYLRHVENAKFIVKNLCDGFFSLAEVLNTSVGSRLFRSFVYVNPTACTEALVKAFLNISKEDLQEIIEGRRNLVWALEKLCFRPETFKQSTKVMAAFAIAENENIGNNATHQFLQLFHIHLPGTAVDLNERWEIVEYCLNKNSEYQFLGLRAIASALSVGQFTRMGGAEDQGDPMPLVDYQPTGSEVYKYWEKAIAVLDKLTLGDGELKTKSIEVVKSNFYGLVTQGAGKIVVPLIKKFIREDLYDRMEARTQIQFILNSDRVFDKPILDELNELYELLAPHNFEDKFKIYVQKPSYHEYRDGVDSDDRGKNLSKKVEALSDEFIEIKPKWKTLVPLFMEGHVAEGYNFAKNVAQKIENKDFEELVNLVLDEIKVSTPEKRNLSVLLGLLANSSDKAYVRTIFQKLIHDKQLKGIAFAIARSVQLELEDIKELITESKNGNFLSSSFGEFTFGWGLRHFSEKEVIEIIEGIRGLDDVGKATAFFVLATWANNDDETIQKYAPQLRSMILEDSSEIFKHVSNTMDMHYYNVVLSKLLKNNDDAELAKAALENIIEQSNQVEYFYSREHSFREIINILQEKQYFSILWNGVSQVYLNFDKYAIAAFHLKDILGSRHDYYNQSIGPLFGGDPEKFVTVFEWCKNHRANELYWIAELLPLFDGERNADNKLHPYLIQFLDEFGEDKRVLDAISSKIGTYSWVGSIVPKLLSDKALFQHLLSHNLALVREWAQAHLDDLDKRIKWETDRDEEGL